MKNKSCGCIEKLRKEIMRRDKTIKYVSFDCASIMSFNKDGSSIQLNQSPKTGQRIEYSKTITNKKGVAKEKVIKTFVSHTHCPWCGIKYKF